MKMFFVLLSFIPWFIYFVISCKLDIKLVKKMDISKKWIKKHLLKIFHFDNIFLFIIFAYFSIFYAKSNQIFLTNLLLFVTINLYLLANRYCEEDIKKIISKKEDNKILICSIIPSIIPIIFYIITRKYLITYYILFAFSFLHYIFVTISYKITKNK